MKNFIKNIRPWLPTIILLLLAAFAFVRMQTVQAALIQQVEKKQDREVYQVDKKNLIRELDLVHKSLTRIEAKLDNALSRSNKNSAVSGRN